MITQHYFIDDYDWNVYILYSVNDEDLYDVKEILEDINCSKSRINEGINNIRGRRNTGFTYSNLTERVSVMVVCETDDIGELLNTLIHECYHLVKHIFKSSISSEEDEAKFIGNFIQLISRQLLRLLNSL